MKKFKELIVNSWALLKRIFHSFKFTFFYCIGIELVEEILEEFIAWELSNVITLVITKAFSAVVVFLGTQSIKFVIKKTIKNLTYKEGNDKVSKVKSFLKLVFANKKSIGATIGVALGTLTGTGIVDIEILPTIMVGSVDVAPFLYYGVIAVLIVLGVSGKGWETVKQFFTRKAEEKVVKEAKAIEKQAKKEIAHEKKLANQTQAEQEKAKAKANADAQAKAEKEKADAEYRAKVEEAKRKLLAQNNNNQNA